MPWRQLFDENGLSGEIAATGKVRSIFWSKDKEIPERSQQAHQAKTATSGLSGNIVADLQNAVKNILLDFLSL